MIFELEYLIVVQESFYFRFKSVTFYPLLPYFLLMKYEEITMLCNEQNVHRHD